MSAINIPIAILQSDAGVSAKVGKRVFPVELPEEKRLPAIVVNSARLVDGMYLYGQNQYPVLDIIVDAYGNTYDECVSLGDLIKDAMLDYRGNIAGYECAVILEDIDFVDHGEDGDKWRRRTSFNIRHRKID